MLIIIFPNPSHLSRLFWESVERDPLGEPSILFKETWLELT